MNQSVILLKIAKLNTAQHSQSEPINHDSQIEAIDNTAQNSQIEPINNTARNSQSEPINITNINWFTLVVLSHVIN